MAASRRSRRDAPPPRSGNSEVDTLRAFLDYLRDSIAAKVEGAPEPQVRTTIVPSGTTLLGLVTHLDLCRTIDVSRRKRDGLESDVSAVIGRQRGRCRQSLSRDGRACQRSSRRMHRSCRAHPATGGETTRSQCPLGARAHDRRDRAPCRAR